MKRLLCMFFCLIFTIQYNKTFCQYPVASPPAPLRYSDETITDFGMGLDNYPTVLPSKDIIFNVTLLGGGMYHSKYLGKTGDGSNLYERPEKIPDLDGKFTYSKLFHLDGNIPELFLFDSELNRWVHYNFEEKEDLKIFNPTLVIAGGGSVNGEFTIMKIGQKNILLKTARSLESGYYYPNNQSAFSYPPSTDIGFNKGYDEQGNWFGDKSIFYINYAEQIDGKEWEFGDWKRVKMDNEDFTLTTFSNQIKFQQVDLLRDGSPQLLISHDIDQLSLYKLNYQTDKLEAVSQNLPQGIKEITDEVYFSMPFTSTIPYGEENSGFVIGGNPGVLIEYYWDNINNSWSKRPLKMKGGDLRVETLAVPTWIDWDGDGIPDIISGDSSGFVWFFKNTGTAENPVWNPGVKLSAANTTIHHQAGLTGSIQGPNEKRWGYTQPLVTDWDGDGLLDIVCNDITGYYVVYKNIGTVGAPVLDSAKPIVLGGSRFKAAWRSKPTVLPMKFVTPTVDEIDPLLAINGQGVLSIYTRNKANPNELIIERTLLNVKNEPVRIVGHAGNEGRATLGICDINQDGVWDIVFGQGYNMYISREVPQALPYASAYVMVNKGTNENPRFGVPSSLCDNQGEAINMDKHGCWISPIMDANYKIIDLLAGGEDGSFYLFKNPNRCSDVQIVTEVLPASGQGSLGSISFNYGGEEVVYTSVRAKDGNIWLQQNVGSSRIATSRTDNLSYGDLFSWGRWDDGHHFRDASKVNLSNSKPVAPNNPLILNGSNPFYWNSQSANWWWSHGAATDKVEASNLSEVSVENGCDPCKKLLGGQWRLPTWEEWEKLLQKEGITSIATAHSSNLKIPSAGTRSNTNGNIENLNSLTKLWSGSTNNTGEALATHIGNLTVSGITRMTAKSDASLSRGEGLSIRCIKRLVTSSNAQWIESGILKNINWDYSFGNRTGTVNGTGGILQASTPATEVFLPKPTSGEIQVSSHTNTLANSSSFTLNGDGTLTMVSNIANGASLSPAKFVAKSFKDASQVMSAHFTLKFHHTAVNKLSVWYIATGANTNENFNQNNSPAISASAASDNSLYTLLKFRKTRVGGSYELQARYHTGTVDANWGWQSIVTGLPAETDIKIDLFFNNSATSQNYTFGGGNHTLAAQRYHIWINDEQKGTSGTVAKMLTRNQRIITAGTYEYTGDLSGLGIMSRESATSEVNGVTFNANSASLTISGLKVAHLSKLTTTPVTLIDFKGNGTNKGIALSWQTANEQNNSYFILNRSANGKDFFYLTRVEGKGTANNISNYGYTDRKPFAGTNYYQLEQVDTDGAKTVTDKIVAVKYVVSNEIFAVFRLSSNQLRAFVSSERNEDIDLRITDISGKVIYKTATALKQGNNQIDLFLPAKPGIYVATLRGTTETKSVKFIL